MDVVLDNIGFSLQRMGGGSMVWKALIESLKDSNLSYKCLEYPGALDNKVRKEMSPFNVELHHPLSLFIERYLSPRLDIEGKFVFHSSYYRTSCNKNAINITTVHDFTPERFWKGISLEVHKWQKYKSIRRSDIIVSISESTKKDILHYLPDIDEKKIRVIYNGVSEDYKKVFQSKYSRMENFIVYVGSRGVHKNFPYAVNSIKDTGFSLAIVGAPLSNAETTFLDNELGRNRYKYMGFLSNQDLNELYNVCFCLAYPSSYEGFGIPVIEAQRAGCPVIAFNASSIPEVIGESPLLLNELSVKEFKKKIEIIKSESNRKDIIDYGFVNSSRFSWKNMGDSYVELYKELLGY